MPPTTPLESTPWIATLLSDKTYITTPMPSRIPKSSTEDNFFARTINTPSTIPACIMQYQRPDGSSGSQSKTEGVKRLRLFVRLAENVTGYPGTLHGGVTASLLDESMGLLLGVRGEVGPAGERARDGVLSEVPVTAYLNTRFKRPIPVPADVVVNVWLREGGEAGGRKWVVGGDVRDENEKVLAEGECLYVRVRASKL
ncbi:HotDog domain-containing protein [Aspergillus taichungensis]|uniref:HotDog domain-containing protein n=1 Tax=Aspergillus taichungensis TaxID=482145 RepID=A0A2J5HWT3_9EURO|nr:HotDog domain-containing protein [Aspergillus taichungensis]